MNSEKEIFINSCSNFEEAMMISDSDDDDTSDSDEDMSDSKETASNSTTGDDDSSLISDSDEETSGTDETTSSSDSDSDEDISDTDETSSSSDSESDDEKAMMFSFTPETLMSTYRRRQPFSLPDSIMHYISKNPSTANTYKKLAMSCKYFFIKNPIIVVSSLFFEVQYEFDGADEDGWHIELDGECLDIDNITSKIWVTKQLYIRSGYDFKNKKSYNFIFLPKIYRSDAKECTLEYIDFSFKDMLFYASKAEKVSLDIQVIDDDGTVLPFEKIVATLPFLKEFHYDVEYTDSSKIITPLTVQELIKIPHFSNLVKLKLENLPDTFDIDSFYKYIKENKKTKISLHFHSEIPDAYENRLKAIITEILEDENRIYVAPDIYFDGIDRATYQKMLRLR